MCISGPQLSKRLTTQIYIHTIGCIRCCPFAVKVELLNIPQPGPPLYLYSVPSRFFIPLMNVVATTVLGPLLCFFFLFCRIPGFLTSAAQHALLRSSLPTWVDALLAPLDVDLDLPVSWPQPPSLPVHEPRALCADLSLLSSATRSRRINLVWCFEALLYYCRRPLLCLYSPSSPLLVDSAQPKRQSQRQLRP